MTYWRLFGLLLAAMVLGGCVKPPAADDKRYLWPPSADHARIEYLGFYASGDDLRRGEVNWMEAVVLGKEQPQPLFQKPHAVDARFNKVVVADTIAGKVFLLDFTSRQVTVLGGVEEGNTKSLTTPTGVAFAGPGEIWVVNSLAAEVRRYAADGRLLGFVGRELLTRPTAVAVDHASQRVVVVDTAKHRLALFTLAGDLLGYVGERGEGPGQFNYPLDADFDTDGNLFVLDALNARVQRFRWDGAQYQYVSEFGERGTASGSFQIPKSLAITPSGHVYVTDALSHKVVVFDRDGKFLLIFGGKFIAGDGKFSPGGLYLPGGIAADERDGIWVADTLNRMIHHFQYLNEEYLRAHPITDDQVVFPSRIDATQEEK